MGQPAIFENMKYCKICQRPLPLKYEGDICPACQEEELFADVREYIREQDVTEYDVAERFDIPLRQVKGWIREGRIEYKTDKQVTLPKMHCMECGASITFGTYCQSCYKLKNAKATYVKELTLDTQMHFLKKDQ